MEQKLDIHNFNGQLERLIKLIHETKDISEENKAFIVKFKDFLLSEGVGVPRITSYIHYARKYAIMIKKPFVGASENDIRAIVGQINQSTLSENSKKGFKITLKRLYRFLDGITKKGVYPQKVEWIKATISNNHKKLPEELLTPDEITSIVQKCKTFRDKTLIATLAESGCRISEIALLKIRHVSFEEYGARLTVNGKTGMRKILIVNSAPYLQELINQHPNNDDPESYLWIKSNGGLLCYTRINEILKQAAKDAGIKKRIYPHLLRHSRATFLATMMSDASMKHYFGWTQGSNMASVYITMSGKEMDDSILRASGVEIKKEQKKTPLEPKKCLKCRTINEPTNRFCKICGLPLSQEEAERILKADTERQQADEIMNGIVNDPEIMEFIRRKLKP
jgi:site-specific recombinase XerD